MSALNRADNFAGRVAYAAAVIMAGREATRSFDNCFENYDGQYVSAALIRRAAKNPRLAANLPRYLDPTMAQECADRFAGINLAKAARAHYARRQAEDEARWAEDRARRTAAAPAMVTQPVQQQQGRAYTVTLYVEVMNQTAVLDAAAEHLVETSSEPDMEAAANFLKGDVENALRLLLDPGSMVIEGVEIHDSACEAAEDDGCPYSDPDCMGNNGDCHEACERRVMVSQPCQQQQARAGGRIGCQTAQGWAEIGPDDDAYIDYLDDLTDELPGGHSFGMLLFKGDPSAFRMGRDEWLAEQRDQEAA